MRLANKTNKKDFVSLQWQDVSVSLEEFCPGVYDVKPNSTVPLTYLSPRQFRAFVAMKKKLPLPETVVVVGNVNLLQRHYKDKAPAQSENEFIRQKINQKIYGVLLVPYEETFIKKHKTELNGEVFRKLDLYEAKNCMCLGYAEVGEGQFVRLVNTSKWFNLLGFGVVFVLLFCFGVFIGWFNSIQLAGFVLA